MISKGCQMTQQAERIIQWKKNCDYLYDYRMETVLAEPCTSLQWGMVSGSGDSQRVYFCCNNASSCYLFMGHVKIPKPGHRVFPGLQKIYHQHKLKKYGHLQVKAMIEHPGEANVIKHNGKWLATKNDNNVVYGWADGKKGPEWTLASPLESLQPNFALSWANNSSRLASSSGKTIDIYDVLSGARRQLNAMTTSIPPLQTLPGHDFTEDVAFKSNSHQMIASVGHDRRLRIWDLRMNTKVLEPENIHSDDINCVSWHENIVATGGSDKQFALVDIRKGELLNSLFLPQSVLSLSFSPNSEHLGLGTDSLLIFKTKELALPDLAPCFAHRGLRGLVNDFSWNREDNKSLMATCQEPEPEGGLIHFFRPIDLLMMDEEQAVLSLQSAMRSQPSTK